ncbi:hypothetical protein A2960_02305 [Candidatus Gottesmanbacteria bacterium RIFCSPLOWO2_01_FULL_39_12b]|uniref:Glycosyl transferase family 1 domain-containing protein n=1 Tax=Candidatus Gottesmanbacteria bacterium RIFCSPLOWO2_01_FULL_39_12b TaxID=1798388 RepID=A0A1F6AQI8_9BACT|nr:MAG: hypothetical protein A2960_02305 [Candidatus Gottesmanbacteria bacterium RIFCSPLOWO2_01_FULL_39_12b]
MKVAIIHDSLMEFGGAERVLQTLLKIFPDSDVYTSCANFDLVRTFFPAFSLLKLHLSWVQYTPFRSHNSLLQSLSPLIWKRFNFSGYDLIISSSSYLLSNIITCNLIPHIQYIHCPPKNIFNLTPLRPLQKYFPYTKFISYFYYKAINSSPYIIVNSKYIQDKMYELFNIPSMVIYPPVKVLPSLPIRKEGKYFIIVSRLDKCKNIELAIKACNVLKAPLKIVGRSVYQKYELFLRSIANSNVEFLGMKSDEEIAKLYESAIGFIFTAKNEDFGIAPVEAMAYGVPVIAHYSGGLKEVLLEGKTGLYFYEHSIPSLITTLNNFSNKAFNPAVINSYAQKFNEKKFIREIRNYLKIFISPTTIS